MGLVCLLCFQGHIMTKGTRDTFPGCQSGGMLKLQTVPGSAGQHWFSCWKDITRKTCPSQPRGEAAGMAFQGACVDNHYRAGEPANINSF